MTFAWVRCCASAQKMRQLAVLHFFHFITIPTRDELFKLTKLNLKMYRKFMATVRYMQCVFMWLS